MFSQKLKKYPLVPLRDYRTVKEKKIQEDEILLNKVIKKVEKKAIEHSNIISNVKHYNLILKST